MKESSCIKRGAFIGGSPQYAESEMMMPLTGLVSPTDSESSPTDPPEIPPIDTHASRTWHFPLNCTKRQYQYDIAKQSLHSNTLIILPAGLGKTFIASVVMYNFSRWFPSGKIVFLAPTRPLVTQQLDAMMNLVEVDPLRTAEITGAQSPTQRQQLWMEKSLFFMTPQILQNDLISGICPNNQLVLIVFDEAHRALGSHAYCEVVRLLCPSGRAPWWTRILALTATPATNIKIIQQIVSSLLISTIITRTEDSEDVKPYVHERAIEIVTVAECVEARFVRSQFEKYILSPNIEKLVQICTISERDPSRLSAFHLIRDRDSFRRKCSFFNRRSIGTAEGLFATLISLYHAYDLLIFHGLIAFKNFLTKLPDENAAIKSRLRHELDSNTSFVQLIAYIEAQLSIPTFVSHSKLAILEEKIVQHFMKSKDDNVETLAIVLSQFEDSVHEIVSQISRHSPLLRVMSFVGQSRVSGQHVSSSRKEQIQV